MHQPLLDALDGIVMILDDQLRITEVGRSNWQQFQNDCAALVPGMPTCSSDVVLGQSVLSFFAGDVVRETFAKVFQSVLTDKRRVLKVEYRCDAPTLRRDMRLSVSSFRTGDGATSMVYQSIMLSVEQRPAIPLFGARVADHQAEDILTLCSICARVAWPIGAPTDTKEWIEPREFYRRGGGEVELISHGFCKTCFDKLMEEE